MRKEIVSLILERDGKILAEKRSSLKKTCPGSVILPAGHVESGEGREEALIREMQEELGINVVDISLVHHEEFECEEKQSIYWYKCASFTGSITNKEGQELMWVDDFDSFTHQVSKNALSTYFESKN